jgi:hypothetical protein
VGIAASVSLVAFWSFAIGQTGSNRTGETWDPIHGFADGKSGGTASSSYGQSSPWSSFQQIDIPASGPPDRPATLAGIVVSGGNRRCGGLFRMVGC